MTSEHSVFVLSPPSTLNNCNKIWLFRNADVASVGSISLYNADRIYSYLRENEIGLELGKTITDDNQGIFKYNGRYTDGKGFDVILCISDAGEVLGYIKYLEVQGTYARPMNIIINFQSSADTDEEGELRISYSISEGIMTDKDEEDKYKDYLKVSEARNMVDRGHNLYSSHVSSEDNIFLSDLSIVSGDAIKLDMCYGEKPNPYPDTTFDNYFIGYVAGGDLALYSWTSNTYSVVSLGKKDYYGNPKSYVKTKEGRAFVPEYKTNKGEIRKTKINYISGRYLSCNVTNLGTRLYDTYLGKWLDGEELISDPYSETNKIYDLVSHQLIYSDLARLIPAFTRAYLLEGERNNNHIFYPYRVIGNWVVFREEGESNKLVVCGPALRLYTKVSEFNELMFLNDYTIIQKSYGGMIYRIYSGEFKTFATYGYQSEWPGAKYSGQVLSEPEEVAPGKNFFNSSLKYYKRLPGDPGSIEILTTFAGLIFYKDTENKLYYL